MPYTKKDAITALAVYGLVVLYAFLAWQFFGDSQGLSMLAGVGWIVVILALVVYKKQSLASVGIHKQHLKKALWLGVLFALIPLGINGIMPLLLYDVQLSLGRDMAFLLVFFLINAAWEDLFFVGFLQTRLTGLFKTDRVAIGVGAGLFAFVHVPVALADGGLGLVGTELIVYLAGLFFMHQMFVLLFRKYVSLATVVVVHTIFNWSYTAIWRFSPDTAEYAVFWSSIAGLVLIIAVNIWDWWPRRQKK